MTQPMAQPSTSVPQHAAASVTGVSQGTATVDSSFTVPEDIDQAVQAVYERQKAFFATERTLDIDVRIDALKRLHKAIVERELKIEVAMKADLGKSAYESYLSEIGLVLAEIDYQIRHVRSWAKPHRVPADLANFHSQYFTLCEPYGCVLVMATWNYPFMLAIEPLVGAVAAGNTCVLKTSDYAPHTADAMEELLQAVFEPGYVDVVKGGHLQNSALLARHFDYIFYTGSVGVGRIVMKAAAQWPVPVSLELGGKSPCVVAADADLDRAGARVAFGKFLNCGQTCVAPDYVLVDEKVADGFVGSLVSHIVSMYGADAFENPNWGHIVSDRHWHRIKGLIDPSKVVYGGRGKEETLQIEPTVMFGCTADDAAMGQEIFGPVLPILTYGSIEEAETFIKDRDKPLAGYVFSDDPDTQMRFVRTVPFGGGCINDTVVHLATSRMGFGGVGASGIGAYHGRYSFKTFSHEKSILKKGTRLDLPFRYQPYTPEKLRVVKMLLK